MQCFRCDGTVSFGGLSPVAGDAIVKRMTEEVQALREILVSEKKVGCFLLSIPAFYRISHVFQDARGNNEHFV